MPDVNTELLIDFAAYRNGTFKLSEDPDTRKAPETAEDWKHVYHGMMSYESALDAAGYELESEMKEPDAPVLVHLCKIDDAGSITYTDFRPSVQSGVRQKTVTAAEVFAAHDLPLEFWEPNKDEGPQP
jgi:hypothetical protein